MKMPAAAHCFVLCLMLGLMQASMPAVATAQEQAVTLAWDPNTEPYVTGYIVHVWPFGSPTEMTFDVGRATSFRFTEARPRVAYFFSVVAYTERGLRSPRSNAVGYMSGTTTAVREGALAVMVADADPATGSVAALPAGVPRTSGEATARVPAPESGCAAFVEADCYMSRTLATSAARITSIAALDEHRIALVEAGRRVRIVDAETADDSLAWELGSPAAEILDVVPHPDFLANHTVYLSTVETRRDGRRALSITRYREVGNTLGEPATLIAGLQVPAQGLVPFAVDARGRLYVAVPSRILRFESDGTVPRDNPGASPDFARGALRPWTLEWNPASDELLASGTDPAWPANLVRLSARSSELGSMPTSVAQLDVSAGGLSSVAIRPAGRGSEGVAVDADSGALFGLRAGAAGVVLDRFRFERPVVVMRATLGRSGDPLVVVREPSAAAGFVVWSLARR